MSSLVLTSCAARYVVKHGLRVPRLDHEARRWCSASATSSNGRNQGPKSFGENGGYSRCSSCPAAHRQWHRSRSKRRNAYCSQFQEPLGRRFHSGSAVNTLDISTFFHFILAVICRGRDQTRGPGEDSSRSGVCVCPAMKTSDLLIRCDSLLRGRGDVARPCRDSGIVQFHRPTTPRQCCGARMVATSHACRRDFRPAHKTCQGRADRPPQLFPAPVHRTSPWRAGSSPPRWYQRLPSDAAG